MTRKKMCKNNNGVKIKKNLTKSSRVKMKGHYDSTGYVPGQYRPIKDYLHTMLSRIQGDAFDVDAFHTTFDSDDWKSLCDPINDLIK
jgi:hypothetical protein